jgi:glycosyltransferase involved in cell wall biosynthesis
MNHYKKISIITVTKNSEKTIEKTIKSYIQQNYKNKELIIVDGNSLDGTMSIINKYRDEIDKLISEKDKGIYDALNKGLKIAKGEIIGILHSDDKYFNKTTLNKIMNLFNNENASLIHTNVEIKYKKFKRIFCSQNQFSSKDFSRGLMPPHTGIFFKRKLLKKVGYFDLNFKYAADLDFIIRCFKIEGIKKIYFNIKSIKMLSGGRSTKNYINVLKQNIECLKILNKNKIKYNLFSFVLRKSINRLKQVV